MAEKEKYKRIRRRRLINILLFVFTGLFLLLFFPKGGKFKYEYQKGKPWMHEVLIATFDFPVYKSEIDIKKETDSLLKKFNPYFNLDSKVGLDQKNRFRNFYDSYWRYYNQKYPLSIKPDFRKEFESKILTNLDFIYKTGVLELSEVQQLAGKKVSEVMIVRNNLAEQSDIAEIFTLKKAYEYINHEISVYCDNVATSEGVNVDAFFKGINFEEYLETNLVYDEATTNNMLDNSIKNISLTEGMVLTGERIVFTGDIINQHIFKLLESYKKEYEIRMGKSSNYLFIILGQAILVTTILLLIFVFLNKLRREILLDHSKVGFILFIIVLFALIATLTLKFKPGGLYFIPFAIVAILLRTFYDHKLALFIYILTILIIGFWVPNSFEFIFLNIAAGSVALLSLTNLYRRNKMFVTSAWIIFIYVALYVGLFLYQEGRLKNMNNDQLLLFAGNGLLVLSSIPLIYLFEKLFGFLSDASLLELADSNQPLLRKLAELAPGTFQHSLQVANLAEEAIFKIGGNPLLVRTGALYHDIGKMENPMFFIENLNDGSNPHENLEAEKSVEIIVGHVTKGIEIAYKYRLPEQIIDFIRTHHGTSTVYYFYRTYIKRFPDTDVDINQFSYPGPKPFSKETAVVMMADSVEAASRSLKSFTEKDLNNLVESIINNQIKEGQFNEANITLRDIETVKSIFKKRLKNIYHIRIEYPK